MCACEMWSSCVKCSAALPAGMKAACVAGRTAAGVQGEKASRGGRQGR